MARSISFEPSRTLQEFRLLPGLTDPRTSFEQISLKTNLSNDNNLSINVPIIAAAMQAVSGSKLALSLSREGGLAAIYCSQSPEDQASMVKAVKENLLQPPATSLHEFPHQISKASAAINTHDYTTRVPLLIAAGVDLLVIDSSDGHSYYQRKTIEWIKAHFPNTPVVAGNIITEEAFFYLAESGANAIKIGMGNGSICITQEQKGTGRGQATALMEVVHAREIFYKETGKYVPLISDGGITSDKDIIIALALGADAVMMGRYFARTDESPTDKVIINNKCYKPYWGEGSTKAQEWRKARYRQSLFEEGVEGFVECVGSLHQVLPVTLAKIRSAMSTAGAQTIREFQENSRLELMSPPAQQEGKVHSIYQNNP
ncbi:MAG: IMP dehydrogenase [Oligoflexia bacterium]|nr:IMP dehydrogenase [Oligoflexia bacterium]MBF0364651.1 IMP dehydrogenase [Oligoflexia bacterium]